MPCAQVRQQDYHKGDAKDRQVYSTNCTDRQWQYGIGLLIARGLVASQPLHGIELRTSTLDELARHLIVFICFNATEQI